VIPTLEEAFSASNDPPLRLKLSRNQIGNFRKVSAEYQCRPSTAPISTRERVSRRKIASSRSRQAHFVPDADCVSRPSSIVIDPGRASLPRSSGPDSRPTSLNLDHPFPSTPHIIRQVSAQGDRVMDDLFRNSPMDSAIVGGSLPSTPPSYTSAISSMSHSEETRKGLQVLCDRPLPPLPVSGRQAAKRKPPPILSEPVVDDDRSLEEGVWFKAHVDHGTNQVRRSQICSVGADYIPGKRGRYRRYLIKRRGLDYWRFWSRCGPI